MAIPLDDTAQLQLVIKLLGDFVKEIEEVKTKINQLETKVNNIKFVSGGSGGAPPPPPPPPPPPITGGSGGAPPSSSPPGMSDVIEQLKKSAGLAIRPPYEIVLDTNIIYTLTSKGITVRDIQIKVNDSNYMVELSENSKGYNVLDNFEWKPIHYYFNSSANEDREEYADLEIYQKRMIKGVERNELLKTITHPNQNRLIAVNLIKNQPRT